jgi:hypothetical protein
VIFLITIPDGVGSGEHERKAREKKERRDEDQRKDNGCLSLVFLYVVFCNKK